MIYKWFLIFNTTDFLDTELISRTYRINLNGIGEKDILVSKSRSGYISITYEGTMLALEMLGNNPFKMDNYACYRDTQGNAYLGILVNES